jgi:type I restriction enzyme M protein
MHEIVETKGKIATFFKSVPDQRAKAAFGEFETVAATLGDGLESYTTFVEDLEAAWRKSSNNLSSLKNAAEKTAKSADASHDLVRDIDHVAKLLSRAVDLAQKELGAKDNGMWSARDVRVALKAVEEARAAAVEQLKLVRYFYRHAHWLIERFPEAQLRDVPGLVKLVSQDEFEKNDWSLTPGRYVGVAPQEEDEDFDFEETMREIHVELSELNAEAAELAAKIAKNLEALGI